MKSLAALAAKLAAATARVTRVGKVEGDAQTTLVRGTKRFLFDLTAELNVEVKIDESLGSDPSAADQGKPREAKYKGTLTLAEISSVTALQEVEIIYKPKGSLPSKHHKPRVDDAVAALKRDILERRLPAFSRDFEREH